MLNYFFLIALCIACVEVVLQLKLLDSIVVVKRNICKSYFVISSAKISDHWKEKMVPVYALFILRSALFILIILVLIISALYFVTLQSREFLAFIFSINGILTSVLVPFSYLKIKTYLYEQLFQA